jgi:redox-sensitive bicupin YhaK (pirin superfamily)
MDEKRSVESILMVHSRQVTENLIIKRALPTPERRRIDPFLLVDHIGPKALAPREHVLLPPHPHRGFEPVTILLEGRVEHTDTTGRTERLYPGDVHWITAGAGIVHSEKLLEYEPGFGGTFHALQFWVNLPAKMKMCAASTQYIAASNIPVINEDDGKILLRIIAGDLYGHAGPVSTQVPLFIAHIRMQAGSRSVFPVSCMFNTFFYVLKGSVLINDTTAAGEHSLVVLKNNGTGIDIKAVAYSELMLFGGKPLNEPVACCGPFVMNKYPEVQQAIVDYEQGRMGKLQA